MTDSPTSHSPRQVSRRRFIGEASCAAVGGTALFSTALNLSLQANAAAQDLPPGDDYKAIVCLFLAGGNDSYNMLVPTDAATYLQYQAVRSNLALLKNGLDPLRGPILELNALDTNGRSYGVHPAMPELRDLFDSGAAGFVANVGTLVEPMTVAQYKNDLVTKPRALFSHSDQIAQWQTAFPQGARSDGWGGRIADVLDGVNIGSEVAMNISLNGNSTFLSGEQTTHYTLGSNGSIALRGRDNGANSIPGRRFRSVDPAAAGSLHEQTYQNLFEQAYLSQFGQAVELDREFSSAFQNNTLTTEFDPLSRLAKQLESAARTIKARTELGVRRQVFFVFAGGWDHHQELLGTHFGMLGDVSRSLRSFWDALGEPGVDAQDDVVLFTASDFSRTLRSNGRGTDHGYGGNHIVLGGPVRGQRVHGAYPDASELRLDGGLDVDRNGRILPTTGVDEYAAEIAQWFGVGDDMLPIVLPNVRNFVALGETNPVGFLDAPAEPNPSVTFAQTCLNNDGRFDMLLVNAGPDSAEFWVDVQGLARRTRTLGPDETMNVPVTGRPDNTYTVEVYRNGALLDETTFDVNCDPAGPEVVVEDSCLGGNGRVDVWLNNGTAQTVTYEVSITGLAPRTRTIAPGASGRITWTGRPDGQYDVVARRGGAVISSTQVTINCDSPPEPLSVTSTCLAGRGRVDVVMTNTGSTAAVYDIDVGTLDRRSRTVAPGATVKVSYTGRQNGSLPVLVYRNAELVWDTPMQISCPLG